jgi:hypothetical protein
VRRAEGRVVWVSGEVKVLPVPLRRAATQSSLCYIYLSILTLPEPVGAPSKTLLSVWYST